MMSALMACGAADDSMVHDRTKPVVCLDHLNLLPDSLNELGIVVILRVRVEQY